MYTYTREQWLIIAAALYACSDSETPDTEQNRLADGITSFWQFKLEELEPVIGSFVSLARK